MLEVVQALEGAIAPMECFQTDPEGKVSCSHETDGDHACSTKLLWTRVQGGVTKALTGTTLAELVAFSEQHSPAPAPRAHRGQPGVANNFNQTTGVELAELEIRNLHVTAEGKEILKGVSLDVESGSIHALMGPNGSGKSTLANAIMGHPGFEVTEGTITFKGEDITEADPDERSRMGLLHGLPVPGRDPGRHGRQVPADDRQLHTARRPARSRSS